MSKSHITKSALANSLRQLIKEKPLDQITVSEITENCGLSRHAFYYHFLDKQDLINWIHIDIRTRAIQPACKESLLDNFNRLSELMYEDLCFYSQATKVQNSNEFMDFYFKTGFDCYMRLFKSYLGDKIANASKEDLEYLGRLLTYAGVCMSTEWIENKQNIKQENYRHYNEIMHRFLHSGLYETLDFLVESNTERS